MANDLVAYAVFPDRGRFEAALEALRDAGFRNSDVSAIIPDAMTANGSSVRRSLEAASGEDIVSTSEATRRLPPIAARGESQFSHADLRDRVARDRETIAS
jgi:hypothetical protein